MVFFLRVLFFPVWIDPVSQGHETRGWCAMPRLRYFQTESVSAGLWCCVGVVSCTCFLIHTEWEIIITNYRVCIQSPYIKFMKRIRHYKWSLFLFNISQTSLKIPKKYIFLYEERLTWSCTFCSVQNPIKNIIIRGPFLKYCITLHAFQYINNPFHITKPHS